VNAPMITLTAKTRPATSYLYNAKSVLLNTLVAVLNYV
jgi:hypothetical protein